MRKIRDLGINVIPVTMRPPEIGLGGAVDLSPCGWNTPSCEPSGLHREGLSLDAVGQLRQQLQTQLRNELRH